MILETVRSETSKPSFKSSPCIRGVPQSGFDFAISLVRFLILESMHGLPGPRFRDLYVQNSLNPFLCHRITVSGFTTIRASRQSFQKRESKIQKTRSLLRIFGRLTDCFMMDSCWRSTRFSIMSILFNLSIKIVITIVKMIVSIMPEGSIRRLSNCQ